MTPEHSFDSSDTPTTLVGAGLEVASLPQSTEVDLSEISVTAQRLRDLSKIGLALSGEREIDKLLEMILTTSRDLTSSDGGTLYIVDKEDGVKRLFFRAAQNDSITVASNMSFAVSSTSLAGYAALSGETLYFDDVYHLSPDAEFKFNPQFDADHNYRTKSVLVIPLKDHSEQVIGVLQLINRKRHREVLLNDPETVEREVLGYDEELRVLVATLASQAAVALNNNLLIQEIEQLFQSLVVAASSAIEDRDPTTAGHSQRVTDLTLALAKAVSQTQEGPFKDVSFTQEQLKELRYAGLLHDFGKIGVREAILTKSHKIEPSHFEAVCHRLLAHRYSLETEATRQKLAVWSDQTLTASEKVERSEAIDAHFEVQRLQLDEDTRVLQHLNDPTLDPLPDPEWQKAEAMLARLQTTLIEDATGKFHPVLNPEEADALSVRRGTLTFKEYKAIQDHAQMSYEFLERIPWTPNLENVPRIARSHHERLDGTGYPQGLKAEEIPLGAKLMAIADVYDALTASDRPYKRSMTPKEALDILRKEAASAKIDPDAFEIFEKYEIYKTC